MIKNFITALQFLTIIRLKKDHPIEQDDLVRSVHQFPVIGFLIGFLMVNVDKLFTMLALPQNVVTALVVIFSVVITRAMHIDGLADTLDGLMGGYDPRSRLRIMRDSRLGTAGALGIFFILFLKYLCISNLFEADRIIALLVTPVLARWSQTFMLFNAEYGRDEGMGKAFVGHLRSSGLVAASAIAAGLTAFVVIRFDMHSFFLFCALILGTGLVTGLGKHYLVRKLGGVTGDAIGAMSELNEVIVLLLFVMFSTGN